MPYSTGIVYKIICPQHQSIVYIGSTYGQLRHRWQNHKSDYKKWLKDNTKSCYSIFPYFEKYGIDKFRIIEIKKYLCCRENENDTKHLRAYEQLWMNRHRKCVNEKKAFQIPCIARIENQITNAIYRLENAEKLRISNAIYRLENVEKEKIRHAKYRLENAEKLRITKAKYDFENKEKITQPYTCECGSVFQKCELARHLKTKKHENLMKLIL